MSIPAVAQKNGIVRGTLYNHAKREIRPPYFVELAGGELKIEVDHPDFISWLENYQARRNYLNEDKMRFEKLRISTVEAIKEVFNPDQETLNSLLKLIAEKFTVAVNG